MRLPSSGLSADDPLVIGTSVAVASLADRRDSDCMERAHAERPSSDVLGSLMLFDEQQVLLRATWRPLHGFFNISLWRDDRVVETFHLTPEAAATVLDFFTRALVSSIPAPPRTNLRLVNSSITPAASQVARQLPTRLRLRMAESLEAVARRLRS